MSGELVRRVVVLERLLSRLKIEAEETRNKIRASSQRLIQHRNRKFQLDYSPPPADCTYLGALKFTVYWLQAQGPYFEHTLAANNLGEAVTIGSETYSMVRNFEAYALGYRKTQNPSDITFAWSINHSQLNVSCGGGFTHDFGYNSAGRQNPSGAGDAYRLVIESV